MIPDRPFDTHRSEGPGLTTRDAREAVQQGRFDGRYPTATGDTYLGSNTDQKLMFEQE